MIGISYHFRSNHFLKKTLTVYHLPTLWAQGVLLPPLNVYDPVTRDDKTVLTKTIPGNGQKSFLNRLQKQTAYWGNFSTILFTQSA